MLDEVVKHVPSTWENLDMELVRIGKKRVEYVQLLKDFKATNKTITGVDRVQNVHRYGQYLLRQQQLAMTHPGEQYYRVQKYVTVALEDVDRALKYQIDPRRCETNYEFCSYFPDDDDVDVVFVVSAVTCRPYEEFSPSKDSDFYIKYVVYLD